MIYYKSKSQWSVLVRQTLYIDKFQTQLCFCSLIHINHIMIRCLMATLSQSPNKFMHLTFQLFFMVFPGGAVVKNLPFNAGDTGSIPGSGRAPGEGNGNPLQYSCLENFMDRGAWQATVHRATNGWIRWSSSRYKPKFSQIKCYDLCNLLPDS